MNTYYTIEVEATNYCNADCVFCANKSINRSRGFLDPEKFYEFINNQKENAKTNFFREKGISSYPRVTFCGLGEPLLHPEIDKIIKYAHNAGFYTQLVTNGAMLSREKMECLIEMGLDEMAISLHSLRDEVYREITGLDLVGTKKAIETCSELIKSEKIKVALWRIKHPNSIYSETAKSETDYLEFAKMLHIERRNILGPSEPWSRAGYVKDTKCSTTRDGLFWCNKIAFTFNIDWQGNAIICCNDYNYETINLGNVFDKEFDIKEYNNLKKKVLCKQLVPQICKVCKRWADNEIYEIAADEHIDYGELEILRQKWEN